MEGGIRELKRKVEGGRREVEGERREVEVR
jgi:hypothetical protein